MVVLVFTPGYQRQYALAEGPAELFKKSIPKNSKKKSKNLDDIQDQAASQEVVKNSKINCNQACCI